MNWIRGREGVSVLRHPDLRWGGLLLGLGLALWLPRWNGPIDLRYDAGVYYLLGTALTEGKGYRLLNEPGEIEANQYPPLLPAVVSLHQHVLGTTNPDVVAPWLRRSYCVLFLLTTLAVYALGRLALRPPWAFLVAALGLFNLKTFFLSDMLFADVPFTLAAAGCFLFVEKGKSWWGFVGAGSCGVAAFLLRTAGLALLAAWVADAAVRRQWVQLGLRSVVALVPVLAWQAHVRRVEASAEYQQPAYPYQRAAYQFYNVSYARNVLELIDPFAPERGRASAGDLTVRVLHNLVLIPTTLGGVLTGGPEFWEDLLGPAPVTTDRRAVLLWATVLAGAVGLLMLAALLRLALRGEWPFTVYLAASLGLICLTPWPGQFSRYVIPLLPFLLLAYVRLLAVLGSFLAAGRREPWRRAAWGLGVLSLACGACIVILQLARAYQLWTDRGEVYEGPARSAGSRLFFYQPPWREFDMAVQWLKRNAPSNAIVATASPHWVYLKTGLKAVMPPYEANTALAQQLLDAVPVTYAVVDDLGFLDVSRRYLGRTVRAHPAAWELVYAVPKSESAHTGRTRVYRRVPMSDDWQVTKERRLPNDN